MQHRYAVTYGTNAATLKAGAIYAVANENNATTLKAAAIYA
jgi:hypothetical protein